MSAMDNLDRMTQISLDALWKIKVQECIEADRRFKATTALIYPTLDTSADIIVSNMEEGILPPNPEELPMPPPYWLV